MRGVDSLTDGEKRALSEALGKLRDKLPPVYSSIHTELRFNPSGALAEVRAWDREGGKVLADVAIRPDGTSGRVRQQQTGR